MILEELLDDQTRIDSFSSRSVTTDLVQVPCVALPALSTLEPASVFRTELDAPKPDRFVGHRDAALGQEIFYIAKAHTESMVQPYGVANDLGRESIIRGSSACRFSSAKSATLPLNLTVPHALLVVLAPGCATSPSSLIVHANSSIVRAEMSIEGSANGTPTGKPSAQTLPPEIENRDRGRQCGAFRTSRASPVAPYSANSRKLYGKPAPVSSLSRLAGLRWGESGANRSRPLDAAIAPRRPPRELAGVGSPRGTLV